MRRRSFRELFAPAEDHRGRRADRRTSPRVEGVEQRLSLSAVGAPATNVPVVSQIGQGISLVQAAATGAVVNNEMISYSFIFVD